MKNIKFIFDLYAQGKRIPVLKILLRYYPSYSSKRFLLKIINFINQLGPRISYKHKENIKKINNYLDNIKCNKNRVILLHKINENRKVYIYEFKNDGTIISFIKIGLDAMAIERISLENSALKYLKSKTKFCIPVVKKFYVSKGHCILQTTPINQKHHIHRKSDRLPKSLFQSISVLRPKNLQYKISAYKIDGWNIYLELKKNQSVKNLVSKIDPNILLDVCAAHRDIGSENVFHKNDPNTLSDYTIIDWEFFTFTAPILTDRVGEWLGMNHEIITKENANKKNILARFFSEFDNEDMAINATIALCHLAFIGIDLANCLIQNDNLSQ